MKRWRVSCASRSSIRKIATGISPSPNLPSGWEMHAAAARGYLRAGQLTTENEARSAGISSRTRTSSMPNDRSAALLYAQALLRKRRLRRGRGSPRAPRGNGKGRDLPRNLRRSADALRPTGYRAHRARAHDQSGGRFGRKIFLAGKRISCAPARKKKRWIFLPSPRKACWRRAGNPNLRRPSINSCRHIPSRFAWPNSGPRCTANSIGRRNISTPWCFCSISISRTTDSGACESLEKLVEIDPYDSRNQERMDQLQGRADAAFSAGCESRLSNAATHGAKAPAQEQILSGGARTFSGSAGRRPHRADAGRSLVQAEIFVQYSLQSKAIERLQKIVELFPGRRGEQRAAAGPVRGRALVAQEGASQRQAGASSSGPLKSRRLARPPYAPETCATSRKYPKSIRTFSGSLRRAPCFRPRSMKWGIICTRRAAWQWLARPASRRKWLPSFAPRASSLRRAARSCA